MEEQAPVPPPLPVSPAPPPTTEPLAIVSLVLAIFSCFCGWLFTAIPAVVCGHLARAKIRKSSGGLGGKQVALAGLIVGYLAVGMGLLGIPLLVGMIHSDIERKHQLEAEKKELTSEDGTLKVTTSGMWTKLPGLNQRASLQVGEKRRELYLIVISDSKADVSDLTLEKHHQLTRDRMIQKMKNASATPSVPLTIDHRPALQDEISGTENGTNVVFLHTTIDEENSFQQVLAWTLKSRWAKDNAELREVTNTFHASR